MVNNNTNSECQINKYISNQFTQMIRYCRSASYIIQNESFVSQAEHCPAFCRHLAAGEGVRGIALRRRLIAGSPGRPGSRRGLSFFVICGAAAFLSTRPAGAGAPAPPPSFSFLERILSLCENCVQVVEKC